MPDTTPATETAAQALAAMAPVATPRRSPLAALAPVAAPEDIGARFRRDTADHEMTVLLDEGLYRHLRFRRMAARGDGSRKPTSMYWADLITWPGSLVISADMGSFLFAREDDMFGFFRGDGIRPGYWAEKVKAGDPGGVTRYSPEQFRQHVTEYVTEVEKDWPGLTEAVERDIFSMFAPWDTNDEHGAMEALRDFEFGATVTVRCTCGDVGAGLDPDEAGSWKTGHLIGAPAGSVGHRMTGERTQGFTFTDAWEWNLSDYTCQFLWCCHAIPWGIALYDAATRDTGEPTAGSVAS